MTVKRTENAVGLRIKFFPTTEISDAGVKTRSQTSALPDDVYLTNFQRTAATAEQREIEDLESESMVVAFECGKITPGQYTLSINPRTTTISLFAACDNEDFGYNGSLEFFKVSGAGSEVRWFRCDANVMEDFSMDGTPKGKFTGTIKFQLNELPTTGAAAAS